MTFKFKVEDVFRIGNKTVFAGTLTSAEEQIVNSECRVVVDGEAVGTVFIEGEALGTGHRDLWTTHSTHISSEMAKNSAVTLVSP